MEQNFKWQKHSFYLKQTVDLNNFKKSSHSWLKSGHTAINLAPFDSKREKQIHSRLTNAQTANIVRDFRIARNIVIMLKCSSII